MKRNLKNQTEKHDHENILKSLKIDNEYYRKKSLNKKKVFFHYHRNIVRMGISYNYFHNDSNQSKYRHSIN